MTSQNPDASAEIAAIVAIANAPNGDAADWSPATAQAFEALTPCERLFVEYFSMGDNASQAYRRAKVMSPAECDAGYIRVAAHKMRSRPRVSKAIELAMKDAAHGHGMDREWLLQRLRMAIERAEESQTVEAQRVIGELVDRIAKLKGEYLPERQEVSVTHVVTPAAKRFMDALNMAKQRIGAIPGPVVHVEAVEG